MSSASSGTAEARALYIAIAAATAAPRPPLAAIAMAGTVALDATKPAKKRDP
jgi:hypothetical protein